MTKNLEQLECVAHDIAIMNLDGPGGDKPRLTEEQKKQNHIESEKKRREAIRKGFERLTEVVPDCEGLARSEAVVLQKTVTYLKEQLDRKNQLWKSARAKGFSLGEFEQIYRDIEKEYQDAENEANP